MSEALEAKKEAISKRLTDLAVEESQLLTNRPLDAPLMTWTQYERRTKEIDEERNKLRQELWELCSRS
jgi:hypothetical protein